MQIWNSNFHIQAWYCYKEDWLRLVCQAELMVKYIYKSVLELFYGMIL